MQGSASQKHFNNSENLRYPLITVIFKVCTILLMLKSQEPPGQLRKTIKHYNFFTGQTHEEVIYIISSKKDMTY